MEMESVAAAISVDMNEELDIAKDKFESEFEFSKMDTMIHRFPAGLAEMSTRFPSMVAVAPRFVSIGPYHHGKTKDLEKMEEVKKAAAFYFLQIIDSTPEDAKKAVLAVVKKARAQYIADETITEEGMKMMKDDACFAAMMVCDACFLLLYMDAYNRSYGEVEGDVVNRSMRRFLFANRHSINSDVMLLENQLPWLVIQALWGLVASPEHKKELQKSVGTFIAGMGSSFKIRESCKLVDPYEWDDEKNPPAHLLALLRRHKTEKPDKIQTEKPDKVHNAAEAGSVVVLQLDHPQPPSTDLHLPLILPAAILTPPPAPSSQEETPQYSHKDHKQFTSVSTLSPMEHEEMGIMLTASRTAAFSDMGLEQGRLLSHLAMAPLSLSDTRASWLVNMAALEVCAASRFGDRPDRTAVCSYLALLAFFMVGREDVRRLRSRSLLHGPHSDDDMLAFFKTVVRLLPDCGKHFALVMAEIEEYRRSRPVRTALYKWLYNNYMGVIKVVSIIVTLIGFYRAVISLIQKN